MGFAQTLQAGLAANRATPRGRDVLIANMLAAPNSAFTAAMLDNAEAIQNGYGENISDLVRHMGGVQSQYGTINATRDPNGGGYSYRLINNDPDGRGMWFTPLTRNADGTVTRGTPSYALRDGGWGEFITAIAMMAPAVGGIVGAAGGAAAGAGGTAAAGEAAGAGIAGGSGISLGGTGAMTAGEALGAAGGSGLSLGGSSLGTSLGAAGGSGLSLGGVSAGTASSLGGTLGASLSGLGDSTLSDAVLNGATSGGTGGAPGGGGVSVPSTPSTGGLSSSDSAVLHSNEGYGPGMTGAQNTAYNTVADLTGNQQLASLAGDAAGLPGVGGLTDAASWLRSNPTLGRLLFSAGSSLLSGASNSGGSGGGSGVAETYGAPKQWTSALQRGLYQQPQQVSLPTTLAGQLGLNGASRWVR
jgi:hypothetical protein